MIIDRENCKIDCTDKRHPKIEVYLSTTHKAHINWIQLTPAMHLRERFIGQEISPEQNNIEIVEDDKYYRIKVTLKSPYHNPPEKNWMGRHELHTEKLNLATAQMLWDIVSTS